MPIGLLPLFDGTIAEAQVRIAGELGAEKIIFLSPTMHGALLQYTDALKRAGGDAEIVRSTSDLAQYASDKDDLIFFGDGILPGQEAKKRLSETEGEIIFVVDNAEAYAEYERIDLNHRWLGIAALNASRQSTLADIPDDWDAGSALLRTAVQSECRREIISATQLTDGAVSCLDGSVTTLQFERTKLSNFRPDRGNILEKYLVWPLTGRLLPRLWRMKDLGKYLGFSAPFLGLSATVLAYFQLPAISIGFLLLGALFLVISGQVSIFSVTAQKIRPEKVLFAVFATLTLVISVFQHSETGSLLPNTVILLLLFGSFLVSRRGATGHKMDWMKPDNILILLILFIFSAFDAFIAGLYGTALLCMVYLVAGHYLGPIRAETGDNQPE